MVEDSARGQHNSFDQRMQWLKRLNIQVKAASASQLIATVCLCKKQGQLELLQAVLLIVCQHTSQLCKSY